MVFGGVPVGKAQLLYSFVKVFLFVLLMTVLWPVRLLLRRRRATRPPHDFETFIAPWHDAIEAREDPDWDRVLSRVPREVVLLHAVRAASWQVENGGFFQFFWNPYGEYATEARDGFSAIGLPEVAAVIQQAIDRVGRPFPRDRGARHDVIGEWKDADDRKVDFSDLDTRFHELTRRRYLLGLLLGTESRTFIDKANAYARAAMAHAAATTS